MGEEESVLEAELHLYIMKTSGLQPHEVRFDERKFLAKDVKTHNLNWNADSCLPSFGS